MIRITFLNNSNQAVLNAMRARRPAVISGLQQTLTSLMLKLQRKIVTEKLSGQVLHHRTGKLAASIVAHPAEVRGDEIIASVTGAGGPAFYGRIHERGGDKAYTIRPVNAKALAWMGPNGKMIFAKSVNHPPLPARPFMGPSLEEMRGEIIARLRMAAVKALKTAV